MPFSSTKLHIPASPPCPQFPSLPPSSPTLRPLALISGKKQVIQQHGTGHWSGYTGSYHPSSPPCPPLLVLAPFPFLPTQSPLRAPAVAVLLD